MFKCFKHPPMVRGEMSPISPISPAKYFAGISPAGVKRRPGRGEINFVPPGACGTCRQPAIFWACLPSTTTTIRGHPRPRTVLVSRSLSVPGETALQSSCTCTLTMLTLTLSALPMARLDRAQTQRPALLRLWPAPRLFRTTSAAAHRRVVPNAVAEAATIL
jgi:hypothetical protein